METAKHVVLVTFKFTAFGRAHARLPRYQISVDCSQSPYFFVGFSRPVRFDGTAAILVCKSERDLGRVSKLPRGAGVGVSIVR